MKNILWITLLICGCATKPARMISPRNSIEAESLTGLYKNAINLEQNGDISQACIEFEKINELNIKPLSELATYHRLSTCNVTESDLKNILNQSQVASNFIQGPLLTKLLEIAEARKFESLVPQIIIKLIIFKKSNQEKSKLLTQSIKILKKIKDEENEKIHFSKLIELSPRLNQTITNENILLVAKDYDSNREFQRARELYQQIIDSIEQPIDIKIKAMNGHRLTFKNERDIKSFLDSTYSMNKKLSEMLLQDPKNTKLDFAQNESALTLARAIWTEHRPEEATKILEDLLNTKTANQNQLATARWLIGSIFLEAKENKKALQQFKLASNFKITDNAVSENIQWAIVWNQYLMHQYLDANKSAEIILKTNPNISFQNKIKYWKGKALQKLKRIQEAKDIFTKLTIDDQFGYYGIISNSEIDSEIQPISTNKISFNTSGDDLLDWLIKLNELQFSEIYLKEINFKFKTYEQREKILPAYYACKWYQGGMNQINYLPAKNKNQITADYIDIMFPTPFSEAITNAAFQFQVPKELIFAIIRQESVFVPTERSGADAFGLMQLIPENAKKLSKKHSIKYENYTDLYLPQINIQMGAALLSELIKRNNSKFIQTVSGYNASESVFQKWEAERFHGNYIEFIEMIPYEETRNYIKYVFRNYITYKRIFSKEAFKMESNFFERPLSN